MLTFPTLRTGAFAQYPAERTVQFRNQVLRFLDGSEQKYRMRASVRRKWKLRLELLDESELASLEQFFLQLQGTSQNFTFTDPWDGTAFGNCRLEKSEMANTLVEEMQGSVEMIIVEGVG